MSRRHARPSLAARAGALLLALASLACGRFPRDPEGTLEEVRGGVLRVGAVASPSLLERTPDGADGPEAQVVERVARALGARVEWVWLAEEEAMERLERFELHVVAAGLSERSPWSGRVALTRPWSEGREADRVLAVPPGENGFLVAVERALAEGAAR